MIRLCIITTVPVTLKAFFHGQLEFLKANGFDITIITSSCGFSNNGNWNALDGLDVFHVEMQRRVSLVSDIKALYQMVQIIRKGKFDIVQYATPKASLFGSVAAWLGRVPVRIYSMWGLYYVTQKNVRRFAFKLFEKLTCALSTHITPDSYGNKEFAIREKLCKSNKIQVVGKGSANGVDLSRFDPKRLRAAGKSLRRDLSIPDDAVVLGCIAPTVRDKGINELVLAFDEVARRYENVYLLYLGRPTEKNPVDPATIEILRQHPRIRNLDAQPDVERYFSAMDIFVLPTYREGLGVVNIEASAMELPVISTKVPGPQETITHLETGLLVPAKDVNRLVDAMAELIEHSELRRRFGSAGRRLVAERYEQKSLWHAILQHRLDVLKEKMR